MFKKILFPTDFSEPGNKVMDYILSLKEAGVEKVFLVHVVDLRGLPEYGPVTGSYFDADTKTAFINTSKMQLEKLAEALEKEGIKTEVIVKEGIPYEEILNIADEKQVSLIMIGYRGHGFMEDLFIGSTAEKVIRKSKIPVFLIK